MAGLKKYFRNQVFENVVFLYISAPHISPLFSLYKLYNLHNLFSANREFSLHVVLFISKSFNLNVHALLVVPFATAVVVCQKISIIRSNIIMKVGFPTDAIYIRNKKIDL